MKDKDTFPTYEVITPNFQLQLIKKQKKERPTQEYLDGWGLVQRQIY